MLDNIIKDSKKDLEVYFNKIEEIIKSEVLGG